MNKDNKRFFFTIPMVLTSVLFVTACKGNTESGTIIDAYSTYSSVKVCRNTDAKNYYENWKSPLKADISMMKNESESTQLIFTTGKRVNNFEITKSDLKDAEGNVISSDDVTVYVEKYVYLERAFETSNGHFLPGDYIPDALIPFNYIKDADENFIPSNSNQGFVIDVKSTRDTVPGTYFGKVTFDFDGAIYNVPVEVNVWDIEYSGKRSFMSTFWIYKNQLIAGEYDDSQKIIDNYIRMFNDFKVNTMPLTTYNAFMPDENMADYVRYQCELFDESDNYSSIPIPYTPVPTSYTFSRDPDNIFIKYVYRFLRELTAKCTEEKNYLDNVVFYFSNFDEMDVSAERYTGGLKFYGDGGEYGKAIEYIIELLEKNGSFTRFSSAKRNELKESIRAITNVNAIVNFTEEIVDNLNMTYCPYISQFNDDVALQRYQDSSLIHSNGNLWAYTCCGPTYPYPTFHIDDFNIGTRATGWMLAQKGVNGYLYWCVNQYMERNGTANGNYVDPYGEPWRTANCPGDGFLCYPGRKYGSSSPFPSMRLLNFRETMDDYDMIEHYSRVVEKRNSRYNKSFDGNALISDLYDSVFKGTIAKTDHHFVEVARKTLANRILAADGYDGIIAVPGYEDSSSYVDVYSVNSSLTINGNTLTGTSSGSGYKYHLSYNFKEQMDFSILGLTGTYDYSFNSGINAHNAQDVSGITMTQDSSVTASDNKLHFNVNSIYRDGASEGNINGATERYKVGATFNSSNYKNIIGADVTMTNTCDEVVTVRFTLKGEDENKTLGSVYLEPGQTRTVHMSADDCSSSFRKGITSIALQLDNVHSVGSGKDTHNELWPERSFDIDSFTFNVREGD